MSPIPLSKRITVTFIDVKYERDVNAVTLLKQLAYIKYKYKNKLCVTNVLDTI